MPLVIFDCDGVLVESESIYITSEIEFLSQHGLEFERNDYMQTYMGMAPREWEQKLSAVFIEHHGREIESEFFRELDNFTMQRFREQLVAVDGARKTIERLNLEKCVASSSSPESLNWKLTHTGLVDLFGDNLFSTILVENGKPAPDLFLFAADAMRHSPSKCVVIEDSSNGVIAAKRAGMAVIGFAAASHCDEGHATSLVSVGADVIVDTYDELLYAISGLV